MKCALTFLPTEEPLKFSVPLESTAAVLEGTFTLVCKLNRSNGDVVWRHNGTEIKTGGRYKISTDGMRCILTVSGVCKEDEGEYNCESKDDKTSAKVTTKGCFFSIMLQLQSFSYLGNLLN